MAITFTKPTVGASTDTWGTTLNGIIDDIADYLDGTTAITPNLTAGSWSVSGTAVTATAAELNKLDGVTATTAEINHIDGVTSNVQTQLDTKALASRTISAGSGLAGGGSLTADRTISHADTSSQASVNNSGTTVIQDVTLDTYGHVTGLASTTIPTYSAPTSLGAVGTYAFLFSTGNQTISAGSTYSGSSFRYAGVHGFGQDTELYFRNDSGASPSGTWRAMGHQAIGGRTTGSVFLRIS